MDPFFISIIYDSPMLSESEKKVFYRADGEGRAFYVPILKTHWLLFGDRPS